MCKGFVSPRERLRCLREKSGISNTPQMHVSICAERVSRTLQNGKGKRSKDEQEATPGRAAFSYLERVGMG